jgi:hypothetical protein
MTELRERLDSLARLAGDDASAERMLGRVAPMVHAVRRRRTARHVGMSAAGIGTAAAVGLVGVAVGGLGHGRGTTLGADASESARDHLVVPTSTECGTTVTPATPADDQLRLFAGLSGSVDEPVLSQTVSNQSTATVFLESDQAQQVLVLRDGRVVARVWGSIGGMLPAGSAISGVGDARGLTLCGGNLIDDGSYQLVVVANTSSTPDQVTVVGEATRMEVSGGVARTPDYDQLASVVKVTVQDATRFPDPPTTPDPVPFREGSDPCAQPVPGSHDAPAVGSMVTLRASASVIGDVAVGTRPEVIVKQKNVGDDPLAVGLILSSRVVVYQGLTPVVAYTADGAPLGPSGDAGGELTLEPDREVGYVAGLIEPTWCLSGPDRLPDGNYTVATMASVSVNGVSRSVVSTDGATAKDGVLTIGGELDGYTVEQPTAGKG